MNLLVKPPSFIMIGHSPTPLGLVYMAAMDKDTEIFDMVFDKRPFREVLKRKPKVVGVQMYSTSRHESLELLRTAKNHGCVTVAGGPHPSVMAKQMAREYPFVDHIVVGDGEYAWKWIVDYYQGHNFDKPPRVIRIMVEDLNTLPVPAWERINIKRYDQYHINALLGKGCNGQCIFCSAWWVNGKYRTHSYEWLMEHLDKLNRMGVRHLRWQDDCLTESEEATEDFIRALSHFKLRGIGTTRVDRITEQQIIDLKKVGIYSLGFGIESGSQYILDMINKRTDLEQALKVREWCRKHGMHFKALMMEGFPFETAETKREDIEFRKRLHPDEWGTVGHIIVLPGTKMYRDLKKEGKIGDDFWLGDQPYYRIG